MLRPATLNMPMLKKRISGAGFPVTFSITFCAWGPCTWYLKNFRVPRLTADLSSLTAAASYPPVSTLNWTQLMADGRPTRLHLFSSR